MDHQRKTALLAEVGWSDFWSKTTEENLDGLISELIELGVEPDTAIRIIGAAVASTANEFV